MSVRRSWIQHAGFECSHTRTAWQAAQKVYMVGNRSWHGHCGSTPDLLPCSPQRYRESHDSSAYHKQPR